MIPVARKLLQMNHRVFIGAGEEHLAMFRGELPAVECIYFPGFKPVFSRFMPQYLSMFIKIPSLVYHILVEHFRLKKIISSYSIDAVISDNRFGLWNRSIRTAYFTHQLRIPFPRPFRCLEPAGIIFHRAITGKYSLCMVPDFPGEMNFTGRLSHNLKTGQNVRYTGILSRFCDSPGDKTGHPGQTSYAVILSGPQPRRELLERKLAKILRKKNADAIFLEGRPAVKPEKTVTENIVYYSHLPASEMKQILTGSRYIISCSGYTTVMELVSLNRSALLIPAPGQTEQEYLGEYLSEKGWFTIMPEKLLNENTDLSCGKASWPQDTAEKSRQLLENALIEFLK
jgi:hypothetical protein